MSEVIDILLEPSQNEKDSDETAEKGNGRKRGRRSKTATENVNA